VKLKTQVWQLMSRPVIKLSAGDGLRDAAEELRTNGISGAPVVDAQGKVVGVLSLRDLAGCLAARLLRLPALFPTLEAPEGEEETASCPTIEDLGSATVSDVMSPRILCVDPECSIPDALRLMRENSIHRIFVRRGSGPLKGVLTTSDVLRWAEENETARRKARKTG
jgi:CBS domain-containing protein